MLMWPAAISFPDDYYHRRSAHHQVKTLRVIQPPDPTIMPVNLSLARRYLRVEDLDYDDLVSLCLRAATLRLAYLNISIIKTRYALDFDQFSYYGDWHNSLELPMPPLQSVDAIRIIAPDSTTATIDPSVYTVGATSWGTGIVRLAFNESWPAIRGDVGSISIEFTAGYNSAAEVPQDLQLAILMIAHSMYDNRGEISPVNLYPVPKMLDAMLLKYQPVGIS